jgi:hypothetical protein
MKTGVFAQVNGQKKHAKPTSPGGKRLRIFYEYSTNIKRMDFAVWRLSKAFRTDKKVLRIAKMPYNRKPVFGLLPPCQAKKIA